MLGLRFIWSFAAAFCGLEILCVYMSSVFLAVLGEGKSGTCYPILTRSKSYRVDIEF